MKDKLFISFSGGESSAFMTQYLWENYRNKYDIQIAFANTGEENEETLEFVQKCSEHFNFPVTWIEAVFHDKGKGTTHKIVNFKTAHRGNKLFLKMCAKYGIPNPSYPHCSRELKTVPLTSFIRNEIGWDKYYTAIGIRCDEPQRINKKWQIKKLLYPLIQIIPMTKPMVNKFWSLEPFRLNLKGYEGNCKVCWKKSDKKLYQIARENEKAFEGFKECEQKYENFIPLSRLEIIERDGKEIKLPIRFFRKNRSVEEILKEAKIYKKSVRDDSQIYPEESLFDESCEVFSCNI